MENLELKLIDEIIETQEGFVIDSDDKAEWALNKIAEEKAETQRMMNVCDTMILRYQQKKEEYEKKSENKTAYLRNQLQTYFNTVEKKKTKTQETYKLPSGTLKLKYQNPEFIRDEEKLLAWAKANKPDYIKTKESVNWAELKKELMLSNDKLLTKDGEIVEGVTLEEREPVFEIDI